PECSHRSALARLSVVFLYVPQSTATPLSPLPPAQDASQFNQHEQETLMSESYSLPTEPEGIVASLLERFNSGKVSAMMTLYDPEAVLIAKDGRTSLIAPRSLPNSSAISASVCRWRPRRAMCSLPAISPRSWWTGQLMAQVPTAS